MMNDAVNLLEPVDSGGIMTLYHDLPPLARPVTPSGMEWLTAECDRRGELGWLSAVLRRIRSRGVVLDGPMDPAAVLALDSTPDDFVVESMMVATPFPATMPEYADFVRGIMNRIQLSYRGPCRESVLMMLHAAKGWEEDPTVMEDDVFSHRNLEEAASLGPFLEGVEDWQWGMMNSEWMRGRDALTPDYPQYAGFFMTSPYAYFPNGSCVAVRNALWLSGLGSEELGRWSAFSSIQQLVRIMNTDDHRNPAPPSMPDEVREYVLHGVIPDSIDYDHGHVLRLGEYERRTWRWLDFCCSHHVD